MEITAQINVKSIDELKKQLPEIAALLEKYKYAEVIVHISKPLNLVINND